MIFLENITKRQFYQLEGYELYFCRFGYFKQTHWLVLMHHDYPQAI